MSIKALLDRKQESFIKSSSEFKDDRPNKKFLYFSISNLLKNLNVTSEDILDGVTDNEDDAGIDAIYAFSDMQLIADDDDLADAISKEDSVKFYIIQVTRDSGFSESAMLKLRQGIEVIFNLDTKLNQNVNPDFSRKAKLLRDIRTHCFDIGNNNLKIEFVYISQSDAEQINPKVKSIETSITNFLSKEQLRHTFRYVGCTELFKLVSQEEYKKVLEFKESPSPYAESYNTEVRGYFGLVKLRDLLKFITDENDQIDEKYFEGNVRDYYGTRKKVNNKIRTSLETVRNRKNFWCLNNGITIVCNKADSMGKRLNLTNFSIVNGCQTAHVIYDCRDIIKVDDKNEALVKVIETESDDIINEVIAATNSQTNVSPILLHSNEEVQKSIEDHFKEHTDLYYDRRLNFYSRRKKPRNKIVSMLKLFQVFYSVFEKRPSRARSRPAELFEKEYETVFSVSFDYNAYIFSYKLFLKILELNQIQRGKRIKNPYEHLIYHYGFLHLTRIAAAGVFGTDVKVNLLAKNNLFKGKQAEFFLTLGNDAKMKKIYTRAVTTLGQAMKRIGENPEFLDFSIFKNEELDKEISTLMR